MDAAKEFRSVAVMGPRQSGKTTLCKATFPGKPYISFENADQFQFAQSDPKGFLSQFRKTGAIKYQSYYPILTQIQ